MGVVMRHFQLNHPFHQKALFVAIMLALSSISAAEEASSSVEPETLTEVQVTSNADAGQASEKTKSYTVKETTSATRLETSIKETPQSISVITRQLLDDFRVTTVNDALDYTTGLKVERVEPVRTYYNVRGTDVTNFQIDGIGTPLTFGIQIGDIDVSVFDRIEVLRGANGLLTGTGNPSATINFIRKRPTAEFNAKINTTLGSWDNRRLDVDISSPLNADGSVRGRLVTAHQNTGSYLDRQSQEKNIAYGIIEADITDRTTIAIGHTFQQNDTSSNMWGTLPLLYNDGSKRSYKRSDSTAPDWSYWDTKSNNTFVELTHLFDNDWQLKAQAQRKEYNSDAVLLYTFGNEDRTTGLGLFSYPGIYLDDHKDSVVDVYANGPFEFAGRKHELVAGITWSRSDVNEIESLAPFEPYASFDAIADYPKPAFTRSGRFADTTTKRLNAYTAAKFNVTDDLKLTVGANALSYDLSGFSYGVIQEADATNKVTPYLGAVYDLNDMHAVYGSYTEIYNPQVEVDRNQNTLDPLQGKNYELGFKSEWFAKKLNTSAAAFYTTQDNLPVAVGQIGTRTINDAISAKTKGFELDASGELTDRLSINTGYTHLMSIKDEDGNNVKPFTPRRLARLTTVYKVPQIEGLKLGANVSWQSDVHVDITIPAGTFRFKQESYTTVNLLANYEIDKHWSAALNLYNVTDKKYFNSLQFAGFGQAFYAAPLNGAATLTWNY
jgi:outer membrane receptor for ferric coprogen and ferric-rhodotorulic acid